MMCGKREKGYQRKRLLPPTMLTHGLSYCFSAPSDQFNSHLKCIQWCKYMLKIICNVSLSTKNTDAEYFVLLFSTDFTGRLMKKCNSKQSSSPRFNLVLSHGFDTLHENTTLMQSLILHYISLIYCHFFEEFCFQFNIKCFWFVYFHIVTLIPSYESGKSPKR